MKTTIGIISTGNFATVLRKLFSHLPDVKIMQSSTSTPVDHKNIFPLEVVLSADIIFFAIPISALEGFLRTHGKLIQKDALVVDVCSVKVKPVTWMNTHLPPSVDILATHPLFGPHSTKGGTTFVSLPMIISPVRIRNQKRLRMILQFFRKEKIHLHTISPTLHDQEMARSQAMAFLFGTLGMKLGLHTGKFDTKGTQLLLENQAIVSEDTTQLFEDMFRFNPFAQEMLEKVSLELTQLRKDLSHV